MRWPWSNKASDQAVVHIWGDPDECIDVVVSSDPEELKDFLPDGSDAEVGDPVVTVLRDITYNYRMSWQKGSQWHRTPLLRIDASLSRIEGKHHSDPRLSLLWPTEHYWECCSLTRSASQRIAGPAVALAVRRPIARTLASVRVLYVWAMSDGNIVPADELRTFGDLYSDLWLYWSLVRQSGHIGDRTIFDTVASGWLFLASPLLGQDLGRPIDDVALTAPRRALRWDRRLLQHLNLRGVTPRDICLFSGAAAMRPPGLLWPEVLDNVVPLYDFTGRPNPLPMHPMTRIAIDAWLRPGILSGMLREQENLLRRKLQYEREATAAQERDAT